MEVKLKKSGAGSMHPAFGPVYSFQKGQIYEDTEENCLMLMAADWAEEVVDKTHETELKEIVENAPNAREAKKLLEEYGKKYVGIDINRAKSVKNIIKDILDAIND